MSEAATKSFRPNGTRNASEPLAKTNASGAIREAKNPQVRVYFSTPNAAARLDVSERSLIDLRTRGGGPKWVRIGRTVRYRSDWLDDWADAQAVASTSEENSRQRT